MNYLISMWILGCMIYTGFTIFFRIKYKRLEKTIPVLRFMDLADKDYRDSLERIRIIGEERNEILEEIKWIKC